MSLIEVAHDVFKKEAVAVTGTWDDSKMYVPYPYEDDFELNLITVGKKLTVFSMTY